MKSRILIIEPESESQHQIVGIMEIDMYKRQVGDKNNLLSHLKKVEGKPLTFTLSGVYPERYEGMTVEPCFRLYECRYMVYWPVLSLSLIHISPN